jgi:hypothetical protein
MSIIGEVRDALLRMENLISLSMVTFVKAVAKRYLDDNKSVLMGSIIVAVLAKIGYVWLENRPHRKSSLFAMAVTLDALHKISSLLLVDQVMGSFHKPDIGRENMFAYTIYWIISASFLIFIPVVFKMIPGSVFTERLSSYVYYAFAENGQFLIDDMALRRVVPAVSLVAMAVLWKYSRKEQTDNKQTDNKQALGTVVHTIVRGVSMIMINIIVTIILFTDESSIDTNVQAVWLIAVLIMVDNVHVSLNVSDSLKDYALWKSSQKMGQILIGDGRETLLLVCIVLAMYISALKNSFSLQCGILLHTILLTGFNAFLTGIQIAVANSPHVITWVILLCTIALVENFIIIMRDIVPKMKGVQV